VLELAQSGFARTHDTKPEFPMPVAELMKDAARFSIDTVSCFQICLFGHCIVCCTTSFDPGWWCGHRIVIERD
jgi:hypothetical protein